MKAARFHEWGKVDVVKLDNIEVPTAKESEVLVEVYAAGVNPIDWKIREGYYAAGKEGNFPFPQGWDLCGKIVKLGPGVTQFHEGDEIIGLIRFPQPAGTFAEYTTAPVSDICLKPKTYNAVHAAAVPLASLTAWQALFVTANLQPNQTVLIHAAAGGVGQFAVQLAKWKGAKVIAVGSSDTRELLAKLGADQVIDYKTERFEDVAENVDVVLDTLGEETAIRSLATIKKGGKMVMLLTQSHPKVAELAKGKDIDVIPMIVTPNALQLKEIVHLIDEGLIKTNVVKTYPLAQVKEALNLVQEGHSRGKVVIKIK